MSETNISVPYGSLSPTDCKGLADVLSSVGDKWTIMVVGALSKGQLRYNEIQRRVSGTLALECRKLIAEISDTRECSVLSKTGEHVESHVQDSKLQQVAIKQPHNCKRSKLRYQFKLSLLPGGQ